MTAIVRHFNGTSSDHLDTLLASGTIDAMSGGGWVRRDAFTLNRVGLIGRCQNSNNQWSFYQFPTTNELVFQVTNAGSSKVAETVGVDTVSAWCWVGFSRSWPAGIVKFYFGTSPGSLTLLTNQGVSVDIQVPNGGGLGTYLGGVNQGNLISITGWNGYMDQWNFWTAELSKSELEASMFCGAVVRSADAVFIVPIIGASPEPTVSFSSVADLTVNGTTVLSADGIGCESNAAPGIPSGGIGIRPPDFSGGPGGGINNPPSMFDEGSTGGFSGISPGMEFKPPEYGNTMGHKKYSMGKGLLNQRLAPAFRGLDHLAAFTRRRKK